MWSVVRKSLVRTGENACSIIKDTKRFAGHSKWANIKHDKAILDGQRATLFSKLLRQMKVAIAEEGSHKPTENVRLSQIIEQAKKKNMPVATIKGFLDKMAKSTAQTQTTTLDIRGPGGCIIVVEVVTDNIRALKMLFATVMRKHNSTPADQTARHVFHHKGFVITEFMGDLDSATEDAIAVGAEDVEEIVEDGLKHLQFTCEPQIVAKVVNQLATRNYNVISSEEKFIPHIFATLSDNDIEVARKLYAKLETFEEVVRIHDNIA